MANKKTMSVEDLLNKIATSMGAKVATWNTVEEAITNNICFAKIIDTSKYISAKENELLQEKSKAV